MTMLGCFIFIVMVAFVFYVSIAATFYICDLLREGRWGPASLILLALMLLIASVIFMVGG